MVKKTSYQAGDQTMLRQINLSAIMNYIRIEAPISRSALARKTGLNKATITNIVGPLIARNFIKEVGLEGNRLGRPSMNLILNPDAGFIVGAEIGVDFVNVVGTDFSPKQVFQANERTSPESSIDDVIGLLIRLVREAEQACRSQVGNNFLGLAVGV